MTTVQNKRKLRIFYSCSQQDEKPYIEELEEHLSPLKNQGIIETWHSGLINAGQDRETEIKANLEKADIILLLISPSFFEDEFCIQQSQLYAVNVRVIPIIIRPVKWKVTHLSKLQVLPKTEQPVSLWSNRDQAWLDVVDGISEVAEEMISHPSSGSANYSHVVGHLSAGRHVQPVDKVLPREVSPAALRQSLRHQLNDEHSYLLDRKLEIETLIQELALTPTGRRIVILSGPPGTGKTVLALHVGYKLIDKYSDAQLLVELKGASEYPVSPDDVMIKVIKAFSPEANLPRDTDALRVLYNQTLQSTNSLIILDDAIDIAQISECLPPAGCALIITSRKELHIEGAKSLTISGLPPHDAHKMLEKLAGTVSKEIIDIICSRCDYVPLYILLAGGMLALSDGRLPDNMSTFLRDRPI